MLRTDKRFYYDTKVNINIIIIIINIFYFYVITFDLRKSINMITTN